MKTESLKRKRIINPVINDTALFTTTSSESGGTLTEIEMELFPGGGNMLHVHTKFSETFVAISGTLMLKTSKGKSLLLQPGQKFTVKAGQPHAFYNPGKEKITFLIQIRPGNTSFEQFIHILYKMAADGLVNEKGLPKNLMITCLLADMGNALPFGFRSLIERPLIKLLARRARRLGLDKELIKKYCTEDYFQRKTKAA